MTIQLAEVSARSYSASSVIQSVVTRRTLDRSVVLRLAVTVDAPAHVERVLRLHHVHRVDLAMTLAAVEPELEVWLVTELNVVGQVVNLDPSDRLAGLPCLLNLGDLRARARRGHPTSQSRLVRRRRLPGARGAPGPAALRDNERGTSQTHDQNDRQ